MTKMVQKQKNTHNSGSFAYEITDSGSYRKIEINK
jgi:hypothetical protein